MRSVDRLTRNSISPEIKRKFEVGRNLHIGKPGKKFDIGSLSVEEQKQAKDISEAAAALFVKGVLHRYNPHTYPVSTSASPAEVHMANIISTMDERQFRDVAAGIKSTLRSPEKKKRLLGSQSQIDFRKAGMTFAGTTVEPRLAAPLAVLPRVSLRMPIPTPAEPPPEPSAEPAPMPTPPPPQLPAYNRLTLVVAQVRCIDETDPEGGADEIVFGGAKVEANGGLGVLTGYSFGEFDHDGVANDFGNLPLAQYDLNSTAGYPKLFFAVCYLVESDQDEAETVKKIGDAVQLAIPAIAAFSAGAGAIAGAALNLVTELVRIAIGGDDPFPPYGILLTLNSPADFGGPESYWLDTEHITGQGGAYVITYKWILSA